MAIINFFFRIYSETSQAVSEQPPPRVQVSELVGVAYLATRLTRHLEEYLAILPVLANPTQVCIPVFD